MMIKSGFWKLVFVFAVLLTSISVKAEVRVKDNLGREIVLEKPAERIIALAPHIVENLYAAGAGGKIVGVSEFSDYPVAAGKLPRVGSSDSYNIEYILSLKPDLIIVWQSSKGGRAVQRFEKLGLPVYVSEPRSFKDIAKSVRDFGVLAGVSQSAEPAAEDFENKIKSLANNYSERPKVKAFYQVWREPLQTINGKHLISKVFELCGGTNVFHDSLPIAPRISKEAVLAENPSLIISGKPKLKHFTREVEEGSLEHWKKWPQLEAVKLNNLYYLNPDILVRHTTRITEGATQVCQLLDSVRRKQ